MTTPTIAIQLWSVREQLDADFDGTLERLRRIGFTHVEPFGFATRADEFASAFTRHGLTAATGHAPLVSTVENPFEDSLENPGLDGVLEAAQRLGISTLFDPFVAPERWESLGEITKTADALNSVAAQAAQYGIRVGYHNHNQEFHNSIDGRFALEVFADLLDPQVHLELDLYWAAAGGADLVSLIQRLGDRVTALHVKDGTLDPLPTLHTTPSDQVPAGHGHVALADSLDEASHAEFAIIEFDHYPGDLWHAITVGYEFLTARGLA